jgi:hypothetical protein
MQVIKQRIKKDLNNKIIQNQVKTNCLFYIPTTNAMTSSVLTNKKLLSKVFVKKNFRHIQQFIHSYPLYYFTSNSLVDFYSLLNKANNDPLSKLIFVLGIQVKFIFFRTLALFNKFAKSFNLFFSLYSYTNMSMFKLKKCLNFKK